MLSWFTSAKSNYDNNSSVISFLLVIQAMIIFEFILLSLSTWVVFKVADYLFEKVKNFEYKAVFDKNKKTVDFLLYLAPFLAALPTMYYVDFHFVNKFSEVPIYIKSYWVVIYHTYCLVAYFFVCQDKIKNEMFWRKCSIAFLCSLFCVLFSFTAGFVLFPFLCGAFVFMLLTEFQFSIKRR